jgi:hypothetical protein
MYRSSVRPLTQVEIQSPTERKEREEFDIAVGKEFGPAMSKDDFQDDPDYADFLTPTYDCYEDYEVSPSKIPDIDDIKEEHDVDTYDQYVGAHGRVPIGDDIRSGKVVRRKRELDGTVRGRTNANSRLDTRTYEIEFPDGHSDEYTANVIAENMYAHCDIDGRQYRLLAVLYLNSSPVFRDVWRVYSNTPHIKGMTADWGGWVIGAFGKRLMPYFFPKLLSRPRYLSIPCNIDEAQACAILTRRISSSINSWISTEVQVTFRPRTAQMVHAWQMKGKPVMAGGYWIPDVALTSLVLKGFPTSTQMFNLVPNPLWRSHFGRCVHSIVTVRF